ncbi:MAG TPA: HEAT repeat domain-containing protein [Acidimicrobiales bacterium]|nr:HEAT repeat domain-containing protein [Acidimicrobiales bacterium]
MEERALVAERGLVPRAAVALATKAFTSVPFENLGTAKALLKKYFSAEPWTAVDDRALASAVGAGEGFFTEALDDELQVSFGWVDGRFLLRAEPATPQAAEDVAASAAGVEGHADLARTFDGAIVPEATPNPRTLAFRTGPIHDGASISYSRAGAAGDPRVGRLFDSFSDIASVMVARDFVAITVRRPDRWEPILAEVLDVLNAEFPATSTDSDPPAPPPGGGPAMVRGAEGVGPRSHDVERAASALERAWAELGSLDAAQPDGLARLLTVGRGDDVAGRRVVANRLGEAPPDVAAGEWRRLVDDRSRLVRRAAVDAIVDAGREELRPLLEHALADGDAWVRWKALRGLADLGVLPSRALVAPLASDRDFRVRLEAAAALRR